jgi:seryl-tRNA synthetase
MRHSKSAGLKPSLPRLLRWMRLAAVMSGWFRRFRSAATQLPRKIGKAMAAKDQAAADALKAEVAKLKDELQAGEAKERELDERAQARVVGVAKHSARRRAGGCGRGRQCRGAAGWRISPISGFEPKEHFDLGEALGQMDFQAAAKISGARFVVLRGGIARMERALGQFMIDLQTGTHGYTEILPPFLVRDAAAYGTANLPKFAEDLFHTDNGFWLIPTAEVPLSNLAAGEILAEEELPKRYAALTACFRSEAGSAGRDTRGMLRQHQFNKVRTGVCHRAGAHRLRSMSG